jgi:hypothetical protein
LYSVIASEAKQSIPPPKEKMDCFVASLLAMTIIRRFFPHPEERPLGRVSKDEGPL